MRLRAKNSDVLTPEQRAWCMSRIRGHDTKPELVLRKALWSGGLRYRLGHDIYGKPDLVFKGARVAVFVDGCFWHSCPVHRVWPKRRANFWREKLGRNTARDLSVTNRLTSSGWTVLRFWEHEIKSDLDRVVQGVRQALDHSLGEANPSRPRANPARTREPGANSARTPPA